MAHPPTRSHDRLRSGEPLIELITYIWTPKDHEPEIYFNKQEAVNPGSARISNIAGLVYSIYEQTDSYIAQRHTRFPVSYHRAVDSIRSAAHVHSAIGAAVNIYESGTAISSAIYACAAAGMGPSIGIAVLL